MSVPVDGTMELLDVLVGDVAALLLVLSGHGFLVRFVTKIVSPLPIRDAIKYFKIWVLKSSVCQ